jgi:hypothetical protein
MIYEFFSFYNEFDMLELKLQEHDPYVDQFVITESNKTYNQIDKDYRLESQWQRYGKWHHKIKYVKFDASGVEPGWPTEQAQREWPVAQMQLQSEDIMIISDLDEFLLPADWKFIKKVIKEVPREILFEMAGYWCYANIQQKNSVKATAVVLKRNYIDSTTHRRPQKVFAHLDKPFELTNLRRGGVHLSWMGDQKMLEQKLQGSIEAHLWAKGHSLEDMWANKKTNKLFHWKEKFAASKLEFVPVEQNKNFTKSMKSFLLSHPEWIQNLDNLS